MSKSTRTPCDFCPENPGYVILKKKECNQDLNVICDKCVNKIGAVCLKCNAWFCSDCTVDNMPLIEAKLMEMHEAHGGCDLDTCLARKLARILFENTQKAVSEHPFKNLCVCKRCYVMG